MAPSTEAAAPPGEDAPRGWRALAPVARWPVPTALLTVAAVALMVWRFGPRPETAAFAYLGAVAVPLAVVDAATRRLPDVLTLPSYPIAAALLGVAAPFAAGGGARYLQAVITMGVLWLLYAVQWFALPGKFGFGDVKLAGVLGLYLGWFGPAVTILGLLAIHVIGALVAVSLLIARRARRGSEIPFGPSMVAGALLVIAWLAPGWPA
ncbi:prepilin peptidase [Thermomonospora cellulosilytica]|uniref:Leader peptidase (Prepilin peptidase)/N-methyltransferase n=1 Tax=Thermomonospora cellulosilytica TaxID=1411118 RepID=A0A7W3N2Z7_9ACTN|nr:A24 family peptidase [Thermomonospora cellulosilytica]MBA9006528.1 leader peptidase (prepilin peptidase)/N-methyltransferase [Thermomonospora cellulosilytica]